MLIEKQVHGEVIVAQLSLVGLVTPESLKQESGILCVISIQIDLA